MAYSWGTAGRKFYEGTPTADPWCQAGMHKQFNENENKFLLRIVDETKKKELRDMEERPSWMSGSSQGGSRAGSQPADGPGSRPKMTTARHSITSTSSSQLNGAIDELKGFNTQLK